MNEPIRFLFPGPTYVRRSVRQAMTAELVGHRSPAFGELYRSVTAKLPPIFRTAGEVYVATGSATLVMQSVLQSTVRRRALHLVCGAFSQRWQDISRSLGLASDTVEVPWGEAVDPEQVRAALRRQSYDAVTFAHNETSTGVLSPAAEIAAVVREESDALVVADAVSSLAGARLEADDWGLDVVLTASQKALALPPGLAFFSLSERAAAQAERCADRGFYTDVLRYRSKHRSGGTITTPAIPVFCAADVQLGSVLEEGLEARWARHLECRRRVSEWADGQGFAFLAHTHHSPTVSCLRPPPGIAAPALVERLAARGFTIASGYGRLTPETLRIGHMGEVAPRDVEALLAAMETLLARW